MEAFGRTSPNSRREADFRSHRNNIGHDQLATEAYLKERSNLRLLKSGQVVGRTTYFWSFIQEGGVSKRPVNAILSTNFEPMAKFPSGFTYFEIPGKSDMTGVLRLICY